MLTRYKHSFHLKSHRFTFHPPPPLSLSLCLGEDIFLNCLHQWGRCPPAVKDHIVEFFRIQLTVHHPRYSSSLQHVIRLLFINYHRGTHTDEEGAWATNDSIWQSHLEKLHDLLISDLEAMTNRLKWEG